MGLLVDYTAAVGNKATEATLDSIGMVVVACSGVVLVLVFYWLTTDIVEAIRESVAERACGVRMGMPAAARVIVRARARAADSQKLGITPFKESEGAEHGGAARLHDAGPGKAGGAASGVGKAAAPAAAAVAAGVQPAMAAAKDISPGAQGRGPLCVRDST